MKEILVFSSTRTSLSNISIASVFLCVAGTKSHPTAWRWGRVHALTYDHKLGTIPLLGKLVNVGPIHVGGSMDAPLQTAWAIDHPFENRDLWSISYRQIIDFSNVTTQWTTYGPGHSGIQTSAWYDNLSKQWPNQQYNAISIDANAVSLLSLAVSMRTRFVLITSTFWC